MKHLNVNVSRESLPSWERGLKSVVADNLYNANYVAPLVGARIEINPWERFKKGFLVAPLVGARIEILRFISR